MAFASPEATTAPTMAASVTVFRCANSARPAGGLEPWYSRSGAAGPSWPVSVREVVVPCSGRIQPEHLLKAFETGADAVCVLVCAGDCRYIEGKLRARRRVEYVRGVLDEIGVGGERLLIAEMTADGDGFARVAEEIESKIRALGASPLRTKAG